MTYTLITGASGGIGESFAREYAKRRHNLILVARSQEKLNQVAAELQSTHGIAVVVVALDLAALDAPEKLFQQCRSYEVSLVINNAGFGLTDEFLNLPTERLEQMVMLNVMTLLKLTRLFLPDMVKRNAGGIINVGSVVSFQPVPYMNVYAATKAFVLSLTDALHHELRGTGVKVMTLCPGGTDTGFFDVAKQDRKKMLAPLQTPEAVVQAAIRAFEKNKASVVSGVMNKILTASVRLLPRRIVTSVAAAIVKPSITAQTQNSHRRW
jgi:uncharacterized protein